jgi:hypothetical protein
LIDDTIERKRSEKASMQPSRAALAQGTAACQLDPLQPTRKEVPTLEPREFLFFKYREAYFAHEKLMTETEAMFGTSFAGLMRGVGHLFVRRLKLGLVARAPRLALALQRMTHNLRELKSRA